MNGLKLSDWDELSEWEFLLGCLQEDASAELAEMGLTGALSTADGVESSTTTITTGPTIVQGVK